MPPSSSSSSSKSTRIGSSENLIRLHKLVSHIRSSITTPADSLVRWSSVRRLYSDIMKELAQHKAFLRHFDHTIAWALIIDRQPSTIGFFVRIDSMYESLTFDLSHADQVVLGGLKSQQECIVAAARSLCSLWTVEHLQLFDCKFDAYVQQQLHVVEQFIRGRFMYYDIRVRGLGASPPFFVVPGDECHHYHHASRSSSTAPTAEFISRMSILLRADRAQIIVDKIHHIQPPQGKRQSGEDDASRPTTAAEAIVSDPIIESAVAYEMVFNRLIVEHMAFRAIDKCDGVTGHNAELKGQLAYMEGRINEMYATICKLGSKLHMELMLPSDGTMSPYFHTKAFITECVLEFVCNRNEYRLSMPPMWTLELRWLQKARETFFRVVDAAVDTDARGERATLLARSLRDPFVPHDPEDDIRAASYERSVRDVRYVFEMTLAAEGVYDIYHLARLDNPMRKELMDALNSLVSVLFFHVQLMSRVYAKIDADYDKAAQMRDNAANGRDEEYDAADAGYIPPPPTAAVPNTRY
jgi:hypothetical protein